MREGSVAIVGASTAGSAAAFALRSAGHEGRIALFGSEDYRPYERPPLSKDVLTAEQSPEPLWLLPPDVYDAQDIDLRTGAAVDRVVARASGGFELHVEGTDELHADHVVLATGGRARTLPWVPCDDSRVCTLRDWNDAMQLRKRLRAAQRVLVIGSGLIGAECAASAVSLGCSVLMLEAAERPFPGLSSVEIRASLLSTHESEGIEIRTSVTVETCHSGRDGVQVSLSDGSTAEFDLVIVGVGVTPNTALATDLGAEVDRGIVVDSKLRTAVVDLYAIGDVATRKVGSKLVRHEHFASAQAQGEAVARVLAAGEAEVTLPAPWAWSDQFSRRLEVLGDPSLGDEVHIRHTDTGGIVEFALLNSCLVGLTAVDSPRVVREARRLIGGRLQAPSERLERPDIALKQVIGKP